MRENPRIILGSLQNAVVTGKRFKARLMEPGMVSYRDCGKGVAFISRATLERDMHTFVGMPISLKHSPKRMTNAQKAADCAANGKIDRVWFDSNDGNYGWAWCEGTVVSDTARRRINSVGKVSCGYDITAEGPGGEHHNFRYDYEITGFAGEHLAIEEKPRYEDATIRLNSKQNQPNMSFIKWVKKQVVAATGGATEENLRQNAAAPAAGDDSNTDVQIGDQTVPLEDVVAGYQENLSRQNAANEGGEIPADAQIDVGNGNNVSLSDLIAGYNAHQTATASVAKTRRVLRITNAAASAAAESVPKEALDTPEARTARGKQLM